MTNILKAHGSSNIGRSSTHNVKTWASKNRPPETARKKTSATTVLVFLLRIRSNAERLERPLGLLLPLRYFCDHTVG